MACGSCGARANNGPSNSANVKYIYTDAQGRQFSYGTSYEAKYAKMRAGGGGSIRTEPI